MLGESRAFRNSSSYTELYRTADDQLVYIAHSIGVKIVLHLHKTNFPTSCHSRSTMDKTKRPSSSVVLDGSIEAQRSSHRMKSTFITTKLFALLCVCILSFLTFTIMFMRNTFGFHSTTWSVEDLSTRHEEFYLSIPDHGRAIVTSRAYAKHPHMAGSSGDFLDARAMLQLFQDEFGIPEGAQPPIYDAGSSASRNSTLNLTDRNASKRPSAWIDTYYPLMNTGLEQRLQILNNSDGGPGWSANLLEDGNSWDEDAYKYRDAIPPWHGYSADGEVVGQLIYADYGRKEDYDELVAQGTNLTGKIIITRYGEVMRGLKIKGAEELGAVGVLIYSDLRDDGFVTTKNGFSAYPRGPARNPTSIQRGSVQYVSSYPGDPTTPGYPAYRGANRTEGTNMPKIPSLPISSQNAEILLKEIGDIYTPSLNGKRHLSGKASQNNIRLVNHVSTAISPIWNVMAAIPGQIKDEVVVMGCHRDAWVMGAADPTSGTVSLTEIIRGYGALLRNGWRPLRTMVIASWDAEEFGLIGSTEWGEDFAPWISDHVVAYLNLDSSVAGSRFYAMGSPSLAHLMQQTALDITHPVITTKTLWDARKDEGHYKPGTGRPYTIDVEFSELYAQKVSDIEASSTGVFPLGSGSDFTVFLQRLGVASSDAGFGPTPSDAVYHYHSIYDTELWMETHGDPGFNRHIAISKFIGLLGLRVADTIIVPINTTQYSLELDEYLKTIEKLPVLEQADKGVDFSSLRKSIHNLQETSSKLDEEKREAEIEFKDVLSEFPGCARPLRSYIYSLTNMVKGMLGVPWLVEERVEHIRTVDLLQTYFGYALDVDEVQEDMPFPIRRFIKAIKRIMRVNKKLIDFERGFISKDGIKGREWYKHLGVAPGKWLGYGATIFPALSEAILYEKNRTAISYEMKRLETLLDNLATRIMP